MKHLKLFLGQVSQTLVIKVLHGESIIKGYSSESINKINALLFCRPSVLSSSGNLLQMRDPGSKPRATPSESEILKLAQEMCSVSKYEKCSPIYLICSKYLAHTAKDFLELSLFILHSFVNK